MKNSSSLKNELIFEYAAGTSNLSKSLMASTYLHMNSQELSMHSTFEDYLGEELDNVPRINAKNLELEDCFSGDKDTEIRKNPINKLLSNFKNLKWKKVFNGFYEHELILSNKEHAKLIKMDAGAKVPLHSHNGKEYILVLEGSFCDEFGKYTKGNLQINDSRIKHTPIACESSGCICLTITEQELVFFGPFAPVLNLITFLKSIFLRSK